MTTSEYAGTTGGDFPGHGDGGMRGHAQQTAGAAADEGRRVASVAQDELRNVASEAKYQVRGLVDQAGRQVDDQTRQQKGRLVETMNTLSRDLDGMASEREGMAAELVHEVAQRTRTLSSHLDGREPRELLDDVRSFARRRPGTFLLGALAAGVVVGRLARSGQAAQSSNGSGSAAYGANEDIAGGPRPTAYGATPGAEPTAPTHRATPTTGAPTGAGTGTASGDPLAGTGSPDPYNADSTVRTDTDPGTTWTDPSEPGGRA